jgi:outer membrane protein TolC
LSESEYRREEARLGVYGRVRQAARLFLGRLTALPVAMEADKQSQEYVAIFSHEYAGGEGTTADMVDAMTTALQSRLELIETRYDYLQSAARLAREVGWSVREESAAPDDIVIRHLAENIDVK